MCVTRLTNPFAVRFQSALADSRFSMSAGAGPSGLRGAPLPSSGSETESEDEVPEWVAALASLPGMTGAAVDRVRAHEKRKAERQQRRQEAEWRKRKERADQEAADLELAEKMQRDEQEEAARAAEEQAAAQRAAEGEALWDLDDDEEPVRRRQRVQRRRNVRTTRARSAPRALVESNDEDDSSDDEVREVSPPRLLDSPSPPPAVLVRDHPDGEQATKPAALTVPSLFPYQAAALAWMSKRESRQRVEPLGGLLADEQGLGKTVQMLALCLARPQPLSVSPVGAMVAGGRATLGVLIVAPLILVNQWAREIADKVAPPYGANVCVHHGASRVRKSAELAAFDFVVTTYDVLRVEHAAANGGGACFGLRWWRVILDESHTIRNSATAVSKACCALRAVHRWCLSGTPLQNSAKDLYAPLRFLRCPGVGDSLASFLELTSNGHDTQPLTALLDDIMLRRLKRDTYGGRPLLPLPSRRVEVMQEPLSDEEKRVYKSLERHAKRVFGDLTRRGAVQANYLHVLALLTRLRQACNSPLLVAKALEAADAAADADEASRGEPTAEATAKARAMGMEGGAPEDCPICMDTVTLDGGCITACGHPFCLECISEHIHRASAVADDGAAACPLCRRPVAPSGLFSLRRLLPKAALPELGPELEPALGPNSGGGASSSSSSAGAAGGARGAAMPVHSTKTRMALGVVRSMLAADPSAKCLIFSCYTKYLDIIQEALTAEGYRSARLDGSQRLKERERQLASFHEPQVPVLLLSLKCGVGLNLTAASTVVLCEPWWNPFVEEQAIDRVHRIGQSKDVRVVRLATPDTVEDRVLSLQDTKRQRAEMTLGDSLVGGGEQTRQTAAARLSDRDLRQLFGA